jgi:hypothetical protein
MRLHYADGERAARAGDLATAREGFLEAGACAAGVQLWRGAIRCYRRVLELDLTDREPVGRVMKMPSRILSGSEWSEYAGALERHSWAPFGCRGAQIVMGDLGAVVECPGVGPVMEMMMTEDDLVEARPDARFTGMPIAMGLIILRRAMWLSPRELISDPMTIRVAFDGRQHVRLDELGDWEPILGVVR